MRCQEYEKAATGLESAIEDSSSDTTFIRWRDLYSDLVSHKTKNEIQEMSNIQILEVRSTGKFQSIPILLCFSLYTCYKYCGEEEKREDVLKQMSVLTEQFCSNDQGEDSYHWQYAHIILLLEFFENSETWKSLHYTIYKKIVSIKINLIKQESKARKDGVR